MRRGRAWQQFRLLQPCLLPDLQVRCNTKHKEALPHQHQPLLHWTPSVRSRVHSSRPRQPGPAEHFRVDLWLRIQWLSVGKEQGTAHHEAQPVSGKAELQNSRSYGRYLPVALHSSSWQLTNSFSNSSVLCQCKWWISRWKCRSELKIIILYFTFLWDR